MKLLSVNISAAKPITVADRTFETGIFKEGTSSKVFVTKEGLKGDAVVDKKHHGGPDQAVYLYSNEDYAFWAEQLGYELAPGTFGENLTVESFATDTVRIGDQLSIAEVVLEVTAPRIPCATLAKKMNNLDFVKTFRQAKRPGIYVRVLQEGSVSVGDAVTYKATQEAYPSLVDVFDYYYEKELNPDLIRQLLNAPIDIRSRNHYQEVLAKR